MTEGLASRIKTMPHWRIVIRPQEYRADRLPSLSACEQAVQQAQVRLRGWYFPHLSQKVENRLAGGNFIGVETDWSGQVEYWRFYQSGQFLGLYAVHESQDLGWRKKLQQTARGHFGLGIELPDDYFSLLNFMYTIAEVYEFTSRLCQRGVYDGAVEVAISLVNAAGFGLTEPTRSWDEQYVLRASTLTHHVAFECASIIGAGADPALDASVWFFERFGWMDPPVEVLRADIQKLLDKRI